MLKIWRAPALSGLFSTPDPPFAQFSIRVPRKLFRLRFDHCAPVSDQLNARLTSLWLFTSLTLSGVEPSYLRGFAQEGCEAICLFNSITYISLRIVITRVEEIYVCYETYVWRVKLRRIVLVDLLRHYVYEDSDYVPKNVYESTRTGSKVYSRSMRASSTKLPVSW